MNAPWMCRALILLGVGLVALPTAAQVNEPATIKITQPSGVSAWWAGVFVTAKTTGVVEKVTFAINGEDHHVDMVVPYHFVWKPATPGVHELVASATLPGGEILTTSKQIRVTGGGHLEINEPRQGAHSVAGNPVTIEVAATDPDGGIASVEFFANGEKIGRTVDLLIDPPKGETSIHDFVWESPPVGLHEIHSRAIDESGSTVRSFSVWVYAGVPRPEPRITVSLPDGVTYTRRKPISIVIDAVSPVGTVDSVDILINGEMITSVGGDIDSPRLPGQVHQYHYTWRGHDTAGPYEIQARYQNPDGTYFYSPPAKFTIADRNWDSQPALTYIGPTERVFAIGEAIDLEFHAVAGSDFISEADIFLDGTRVGVASYCSPLDDCGDQTSPFIRLYDRHWTQDVAPGAYDLQARATVNGAEVESAPVTFTFIDPSQSPTITITHPVDEAQFVAPVVPKFRVLTLTPKAFVSQVELLADGEPIGSLTQCANDDDCKTPSPGLYNELEHFVPASGWQGFSRGRHRIVARGSVLGSEAVFESEAVEIYVRQRLPSASFLSFVSPEYDAIYRVGEPIPLRLQSYFSDERGRIAYTPIFVDGARIGHAAYCPPNAFCPPPEKQQINTVLTFYQNRVPTEDWGTWTGASVGLHVLEATGNYFGTVLSTTHRVIVTDVVANEEPQFILPAPNSQFPIGELVPIELTMIMPETGGYGSLSVVVDGDVIGHLSDCPPNADCGLPEPGSVVRLKFYPEELRDPWEYWRPRKLGSHTLKLALEDPDTGELTFGDTIEIQVTRERPPVRLISKPFLQLVTNPIPDTHTLEVSANLIDWEPLALPGNTTALSLTPKSVPTQFFRLSKR